MDYTDKEFTEAFESGSIESFHHRDHIRLAMIYVERYGMPEAGQRLAEAIRKFANRAGQAEKYHYTVTIAWARLVANILDKSALSAFYSAGLLESEKARREWVEPDLTALP
jgi:hypothetical protein